VCITCNNDWNAVIMVLFPSFVNGLARTVSIKKEKNCKREEDGRTAAEELAKEARKSELLLSSSGVVKSTKANNFASVFTNRGRKGVNQDRLLVWEVRQPLFSCHYKLVWCSNYQTLYFVCY